MVISIADSINSILQSIMFMYVSNYCSKNKKSTVEIIIYTAILWCVIQYITMLVGNSGLGTIFIHLIILIFGAIIFKNDRLGAMIGFSIVYLAIGIVMILGSSIYFAYIKDIISNRYLNFWMIMFIYLPQYILFILILGGIRFINSIYKIIKSKNISIISLIILTIIVDFIISLNGSLYDMDNSMFNELIFIFFGFFMMGMVIYFSNIEKKSNEILRANISLEKKNEELKKIKHDYGAQISYLYGLHLMGKYDRLGVALKDIINGNDSISSDVEIINKSDSIIVDIVNGIEHRGINIIIDDQIDFNDINISEMDYQRVISNILRNAVTAMNQNGTIEIRTYYSLKYNVIIIKNNGPKIEEDIINKIFIAGFSSKESRDSGFGLSITKEIVEKSKGTIEVKSDNLFTEFIIKIPKKI